MQPTLAQHRRSIRYRRWLMAIILVAWFFGPPAAAADTTVQVYAASSLSEVFEDLARGFAATQPTIAVQLAFAGSQALRLQIEQGAYADVFASADERHMAALVDLGDVETSYVFARNELVVIVPIDNPARIETFADLPQAERIVIGVQSVPIGAYTRSVLDGAGQRFGEAFTATVWKHVVSEESNVRLVRAKVELGEADAAIVYRTDAAASSAVRTIAIVEDLNVSSAYYIGRVERTEHAEAADLFIDFVRSPEGRALLAARGFIVEP